MNRNLNLALYAALLIALSLAALVHIRPLYAAGYVVNTLADNTTNDAYCTLREAILAANNAPANTNCGAGSAADDTITFSVSGTITLTSTLPNIVSGAGTLTIDGGGNITISGNNSVQVMVVNSGANLTLQNLTVAQGRASGFPGGGVYNYNNGTLTITNSTFSDNWAWSLGGGVYNEGTLTITNSTFNNNFSNGGGGGGVFNGSTGTLTITNSTFDSNQVGNTSGGSNGGGINNYGTLTVTNSTFNNNYVIDSGGGIYHGGTMLTVTNSTFSSNVGGGIFIYHPDTATLKNTIIANSINVGDCMGTASGASINNLIESSTFTCGLTNGVNGNITGVDPNLGTLTGSPAYFPLNAGSPAIDAGTNSGCPTTDQRGATRPQDGDGNGTATCDIGSYEAAAQFRLYLPLILR